MRAPPGEASRSNYAMAFVRQLRHNPCDAAIRGIKSVRAGPFVRGQAPLTRGG